MHRCSEGDIGIVGKAPFLQVVSESLVHAVLFVEFSTDGVSKAVAAIWDKLNSVT